MILGAALDVLARAGPTGFTVDAVAAAAGCGKATIYRRWESRGALLVAAASTVCLPVVEPDLGSVQDDLVAWLDDVATQLRESPSGRALPAMLAEAAVNPPVQAALAAALGDVWRAPRAILRRGAARGEIPAADVDLLLDLVVSPVILRALLAAPAVREPTLARLVAHLLPQL
jgi:AcrR family transcriptional regulator